MEVGRGMLGMIDFNSKTVDVVHPDLDVVQFPVSPKRAALDQPLENSGQGRKVSGTGDLLFVLPTKIHMPLKVEGRLTPISGHKLEDGHL